MRLVIWGFFGRSLSNVWNIHLPLSTLKKLGDAFHLPYQRPGKEECFIPSMNTISAGNTSPSLSVSLCSTSRPRIFEHVFWPGSSARRDSCLHLYLQFKGIIAQNDLQIFSKRQYFEACTFLFFFLKNKQRAVVITFSQHNPHRSLLSQNRKIFLLCISGCNVFHF